MQAYNAEDLAFNAHVARIIKEEGPLQALLLFEGSAETYVTEAYTEAYILAAIERRVNNLTTFGGRRTWKLPH